MLGECEVCLLRRLLTMPRECRVVSNDLELDQPAQSRSTESTVHYAHTATVRNGWIKACAPLLEAVLTVLFLYFLSHGLPHLFVSR